MDHAPGDRVFAKIKGFSNWPARINPLPSDVPVPKGKLPVFFYGTYQVSFVPVKNIVPYEKFKEKWGKPKSNPQFMAAMEEIEQNPGIFMLGQDPRAESFLLQFYDFKKSSSHGLRSEAVSNQRPCPPADIGESISNSTSSKNQRNIGVSSRESNSKGHIHNSKTNSASSAPSANRVEKRPRSRRCSDQTLSDLDSNGPEEKIRLTDSSSELSSERSRPDDGSDLPQRTISDVEEEDEEEMNDDNENSRDTLTDHRTIQDSSDSVPNSTGEPSSQRHSSNSKADDTTVYLSPDLSAEHGHEHREDRDARRLARKLQKKAEKKALKKAAKREAKRIAKENERAERRARREARRERKRLHKLERERIAAQKRSADSPTEMQSDQELYHSDVWASGNEIGQVSDHEGKVESDAGSPIKQERSADRSPINLAVSDSFPESSMEFINDDSLHPGHSIDSPVVEEIIMYEKTSPKSNLHGDSELEPFSNNEVESELEVVERSVKNGRVRKNHRHHHNQVDQDPDSISDLSSDGECTHDSPHPSSPKIPRPESPVKQSQADCSPHDINHHHSNNKSGESSSDQRTKKNMQAEDVKPDAETHDHISNEDDDNDDDDDVVDDNEEHSNDATFNKAKVKPSKASLLSSDSDSDLKPRRSRLKFKPSKSRIPASTKKASRFTSSRPSDSDEESDSAQATKRRKTTHKSKSPPDSQTVPNRKHHSKTLEKSAHPKTLTQSKPNVPKRELPTPNPIDEVVTQLRHFCRDLKSSLIRGHENFQTAVQVLDQLRTISVRLPQLAQAWELMDCIKKCRRYKLSSEVRDAAQNTLRYFQNMQTNATKEELSQAQELITAYQNRIQASQDNEKLALATKQAQELTTSTSVNPTVKEPSPQQPASSPQKETEIVDEHKSLTADLDAKVDDVLSRIRATDERMAAAASQRSESLVRPPTSNPHKFSNSSYSDSGRVIRDSAIAAATATMRGEEDEESVVSRVEQVAAFEAAAEVESLKGSSTAVPPPPPPLKTSSHSSPSVDLDLDSRIQLLMTSGSSTKTNSSRSHKPHKPVPTPSTLSSTVDSSDPLTSLPPALLAKRKIIADRLTATKAAASPSKPCHPVTSPLPLTDSSLDIIAQTTEALLKSSAKPVTSSQDDEIYNLLGV